MRRYVGAGTRTGEPTLLKGGLIMITIAEAFRRWPVNVSLNSEWFTNVRSRGCEDTSRSYAKPGQLTAARKYG